MLFSPLLQGTIYALFAENVAPDYNRDTPTESAGLTASVFASGGRFVGSYPAPVGNAATSLVSYDSIGPSLNDVSLRGRRFAWGSQYVRLFCLNTKGGTLELHHCARYYDAFGYRNAGQFVNCPPAPEQKCGEQVGSAYYCSKNIPNTFFPCSEGGSTGGGYRELQPCPRGTTCTEHKGSLQSIISARTVFTRHFCYPCTCTCAVSWMPSFSGISCRHTF